jgi:hypothetical protein
MSSHGSTHELSATTCPVNGPTPLRSHASTMFANDPDLNESTTTTCDVASRFMISATRLLPTKPAPPVTMKVRTAISYSLGWGGITSVWPRLIESSSFN